MSFIFSQVNGSAIGQSKSDISAGSFYGSAFGQGFHDSMLNSIYRLSEYHQTLDEDPFWNPRLKKEDANHFAQQQGVDLKFDYDPTQDEVNLQIRRHIENRDRAQILAAGATGAGRTAGQIGVQFLGSVLNPLDLPLMFVPVVGTASKAKGASALGNAIRRGIVTEEALAARGLALRGYTAAVIEGSVGQAITEIPLMFANIQDQTDYTAQQFFGNVALGGVFGAGIKTAQKVLKAVGRAHSRLTPETRENMATGAMDDFIQGKPLDPARFVDLDDTVVKAKAVEESVQPKRLLTPEETEQFLSWSQNAGEVNPQLRESILANPIKSDTPVYRTFEGIEELKVGDTLNDKQKGFAGWSDGGGIHQDWSKDFGGRLEIDGEYVALPHSTIKDSLIAQGHKLENKGERPYWVDDEEAFIDPRYDLVVTSIDNINGIRTVRVEPTPESKARFHKESSATPDQRVTSEKQAVESFKSRDEAKAKQKETELQREIDEVVPTPKAERVEFGETPTQVDIDRLEQEIRDLEDQLSAAADEWEANMDALEGNVPQYAPRSEQVKVVNRFEAEYGIGWWQRYLPESESTTLKYSALDVVNAIKAGVAPKSAKLFDELFELDPTLKEVPITFDPQLTKTRGYSGVYEGGVDQIILNGDVAPKTLYHELIHASAVRKIRQDMHDVGNMSLPVYRGETYLAQLQNYSKKTQKPGVSGIVDAYLAAVRHHSKVVPNSNIAKFANHSSVGSYYKNVAEPHYGLLNLDEFIAEAISNRQFQFFLNTIPGTGNKTLFNEFIDKVKEFFSIKDKGGTLLDDVLNDYQKLLKDGPRAPDDFLKTLRKATSKDVNEPMISKASTCILNGQA